MKCGMLVCGLTAQVDNIKEMWLIVCKVSYRISKAFLRCKFPRMS